VGSEDGLARQIEKLTQGEVDRLIAGAKPGLYADGAGLGLRINASGAASWSFRYTLDGKGRERGLGSAGKVTLKEARQLAAKADGDARAGKDVVAERKAAAAPAPTVPTFQEAAALYIQKEEPGWRNPVHRAQWRSTLEHHVYPLIGGKQVDAITVADVVDVLAPIWTGTPETASRVRARIEMILNMCIGLGWRTAANPAALGVLKYQPKLPKRRVVVEHHAALPYGAMAPFMVALRARGGTAAKAVEWIVLTAVRSMEGRGARWAEIDLGSRTWTIPASRMKGGRQHVVPLSDAAMALLEALRADLNEAVPDPTALLFPSPNNPREPLSDVALSKIAKLAAGGADVTVHGFRSTFRDWAGDCTAFPREVAEQALAHASGDKVEQAYRRGTALAKRRELMEAWGDYVDGLPVAPAVAA
jgi:integrase